MMKYFKVKIIGLVCLMVMGVGSLCPNSASARKLRGNQTDNPEIEVLLHYGVYSQKELRQLGIWKELYLQEEKLTELEKSRLADYLILTRQHEDSRFIELISWRNNSNNTRPFYRELGGRHMGSSAVSYNLSMNAEEKVRLLTNSSTRGKLRLQETETILDFGTGYGEVPILLAKTFRDITVYGLDANSINIRGALDRAEEITPRLTNIKFFNRDGRINSDGIGLENNSVDVVLLLDDVFYNQPLEWITSSIVSILEVLKDGGRIAFLGYRGKNLFEAVAMEIGKKLKVFDTGVRVKTHWNTLEFIIFELEK